MALPLQLIESQLQPASNDEELALHLAALEWSLADPIVIESAADVKSRVSWQDRISPFHHQMQNLMTFCRRLPVTLIADDVGLGKTISAGLVLSELMTRRRVNRALVLCPSILGPQWVEEMETKFGIFGRHATGNRLAKELNSESPLVVTTYESGSRQLESLEPGDFDMLILDEAHKLRNLYGTQSPPQLAKRVHTALSQRLFKYVLMLTATPIQNRLWDLYTLVDCLAVAKGHANPFGTPFDFQRRFIRDPATARSMRPQAVQEFRSILRQYLVRTRRDQVRLLFPKREVRLVSVKPTKPEVSMMGLVADCIEGLPGFQQSSVLQAMMSSPAALVAQLDNMGGKNSDLKDLADQLRGLGLVGVEPSKLSGILSVVDLLRSKRQSDWRLVVFTIRKETQRVIGEALQKQGIRVGFIRGGDPEGNRRTVSEYSQNPPQVNVIVSTDAGAEGVNLQAGNAVINYDLPWNPMIVEQRIGRVQRLASKFGHVIVINLAVAGSPEAKVVARLMEKLQVISDTVGDIEAVLEAADDSDNAGLSFEAKIRDLVVKSLVGQDVERATALEVESIQKARDLFDQQRHEIDQTLGDLQELHGAGPAMPKLTPITPAVPFRDFVLRGLTAEGATIESNGTDQVIARRLRHPDEEVVFDQAIWEGHRRPGVFGGRAPKLYVPGKPAFERLVERWVNRSSHRVRDVRSDTRRLAESIGQSIIRETEGGRLLDVQVTPVESCFQGNVTCRVTASNALDSYEKLLTVSCNTAEHDPVGNLVTLSNRWMDSELDASEVVPELNRRLNRAITSDKDMESFAGFYQARLAEEIDKTGQHRELKERVTKDLQPAIHGQVVALTGCQYDVCKAAFTFAIDDGEDYCLALTLVPATGQILTPVDWDQCQESGRKVPANFLEACALSGKKVLKHLLITSDISSRRVLRTLAIACPVTGKLVAQDELTKSDLTGKLAVIGALLVSPISGRRGLPEEFSQCAFTGTWVPPDELRTSEVSSKPYRMDDESTSALSGTRGHRTEFVRCAYSGDAILPCEGVASDLDGSTIRKDKLLRSEISPFRGGSPEQFVVCEASGRRLLRDEVAACVVTKKLVARELLVPSQESGRLGLADVMVRCEVTNKRLLPKETVTSAVSGKVVAKSVAGKSAVSRQFCAPGELVRCELTESGVLPSELACSDLSRKHFRVDQLQSSEFSSRKGHISEAIKCEYSGKWLLLDEAAKSDVSGKVTALSGLVRSEKSGRLAMPEETATCEISGKRLAVDEIGQSAVSGKRVDQELLAMSGASNRFALPDELVSCEVSGLKVLPDEAVKSVVSGKILAKKIAVRSKITRRYCAPDELVRCEFTGTQTLPDELTLSDVSHRPFRSDQLQSSEFSPRKGHTSEATKCEYSGKWLLLDEAAKSDVTGKVTALSELVRSEKSGRLAMPEETATCEVSGRLLIIDEIGQSAVSGKRVDQDLLTTSDGSGRVALADELVSCEVIGLKVLPDEAVKSVVSGKILAKRIAVRSQISRRYCAPNELVRCEFTGTVALPEELAKSDLSHSYFRSDQAVKSIFSGRIGHLSESLKCQYSGKLLLRDEAATSAVSGRTTARDELVASEKSGRLAMPDETVKCAIGGKRLLKDEVAPSDVSGRLADRSLLVRSAVSGKLALPQESITCEESGVVLLPAEAAVCAASGRRVDRRLLCRSQASQAMAIPKYMARCAASDLRVVPSELDRCQMTGDHVLPKYLEACAATKKKVRRDRMMSSAVSGRLLQPRAAVKSIVNGAICCPDEAVYCYWREGFVLPNQSVKCKRTGLTFCRDLINERGEFLPLSQVMTHQGVLLDFSDILPVLRKRPDQKLKWASRAWGAASPKGNTRAVCVELSEYFGIRVRYVALMFLNARSEVMGNVTVAANNSNGWELL